MWKRINDGQAAIVFWDVFALSGFTGAKMSQKQNAHLIFLHRVKCAEEVERSDKSNYRYRIVSQTGIVISWGSVLLCQGNGEIQVKHDASLYKVNFV